MPGVNGTGHDVESEAEPKKLVNGAGGTGGSLKQRNFKWAAELSDMKKALQASEEGTDAHTVLNGCTSVTPLLANFWHVPDLDGPLDLEE